jgi:hypothetical protein
MQDLNTQDDNEESEEDSVGRETRQGALSKLLSQAGSSINTTIQTTGLNVNETHQKLILLHHKYQVKQCNHYPFHDACLLATDK